MNFDTSTNFGSIHASGEDFTYQILDVSKRTILREDTQLWARNLRFLSVPKALALSSTATGENTFSALRGQSHKEVRAVLKFS